MIAQAITNLFGGYSNRDGQDLIVEDRVERLPTEAEQELIDAETLRLETEATANAYKQQREAEYPPHADYLDGIVKGDDVQVQKYIDDCLAVKAKYPKEDE
jgi:hypothetical protein